MSVAAHLARNSMMESPLSELMLLSSKRLSAKDVFEAERDLGLGLKAKGFKPIDDPDLKLRSSEDENIYNRGGSGKSNMFVFTRKMNGRLRVFYSNPNPDTTLPRDEVLVVRDHDGLQDKEAWMRSTLKEIDAISALKPEKTLYLSTHSHLGRILTPDNPQGRRVIGEGSSTDKAMIRQFMLYHRDVDATVNHNHFNPADYADVQEKERAANILKVPAVEITLPVEHEDTFGPHFLAYFSDPATAVELDDKMLSTKWSRHSRNIASAGIRLDRMDPPMTFDGALEHFNGLRSQGKLAIGMAHPAGDRYLGKSGLWNMVSMGKLGLKDLLRIGRENVDMIEMYNTENIGIESLSIPFDPRTKRFVTSALAMSEGAGQRIMRNTLTLMTPMLFERGVHPDASGYAAKGEPHPKSTSFGDDAHYFPQFDARPRASLLGCGRTVIELAADERQEDLTPEDIVGAMRDGRIHGQAFWDFGKMGPTIVPARRPGMSVREVMARVEHNMVGLALAAGRQVSYYASRRSRSD
ncbi:hypothetical protein ACFLRF_02490 [Candidatus Altiarchaeota archaeon]